MVGLKAVSFKEMVIKMLTDEYERQSSFYLEVDGFFCPVVEVDVVNLKITYMYSANGGTDTFEVDRTLEMNDATKIVYEKVPIKDVKEMEEMYVFDGNLGQKLGVCFNNISQALSYIKDTSVISNIFKADGYKESLREDIIKKIKNIPNYNTITDINEYFKNEYIDGLIKLRMI